MPELDEEVCIDPNDPAMAMAGPPVSPPPDQIPVDPWIHDQPESGFDEVQSYPEGYGPGNPAPVKPNDPLPPSSEPAPELPEVDPNEPIPDTIETPDVQPPGTETPNPEIPVEEAPEVPGEPWEGPEPIEPGPDTLPSEGVKAATEGEEALEATEVATEGEEVLEATELATEGVEAAELAEGGAALGELLPVAAAGYAGYELGSAIAPYVYGDKNLDGSPVTRYENVDDIDTDYQNSWAYKINSWLDD